MVCVLYSLGMTAGMPLSASTDFKSWACMGLLQVATVIMSGVCGRGGGLASAVSSCVFVLDCARAGS